MRSRVSSPPAMYTDAAEMSRATTGQRRAAFRRRRGICLIRTPRRIPACQQRYYGIARGAHTGHVVRGTQRAVRGALCDSRCDWTKGVALGMTNLVQRSAAKRNGLSDAPWAYCARLCLKPECRGKEKSKEGTGRPTLLVWILL